MYRLLGPHQRRFLAASAAVGVLHPPSPAVIPLDPDPDPDRASPLSSSAGVAFCQGSRKKKHAINVMLQHRRSVLARSLEEKYEPDWSNVLGEGAYGVVVLAKEKSTDTTVALKKIAKRYTDQSSFKKETSALLQIHDEGGHPNVCGLRDMYEDEKHYYLILDLVSGGEMFEHLIQNGAYSEHDAALHMKNVASALNFLHGIKIIHADLKPENLMMTSWKESNARIKVVDFGCAVADGVTDDKDALGGNKGDVGTTAYWPPEAFPTSKSSRSPPSPAMDMWSLGVILYIMLTGLHPFDLNGVSTDEEIEARIQSDPRPKFEEKLTGHLSPAAVDLIKKLMTADPNARISASEMLAHPWIRGGSAKQIISDSHVRLEKFKEVRDKLEAGIFAVLVTQSTHHNESSNNSRMIEKAFEVFDKEHKGAITPEDISRVLADETDIKLTSQEQRHISDIMRGNKKAGKKKVDLSSFSDLMSSLNTVYFAKNQAIFTEGEKGDRMYFINAGKVVVTQNGSQLGTLGQGDFFGEGSMLDPSKCRSATVTTTTPVEVIEIPRHDYERFVKDSASTKTDIEFVRNSRMLKNAKNLIRLQTGMKTHELKQGETVFKEGEPGSSMFAVSEDGGELRVTIGGVEVGKMKEGDMFGETALLLNLQKVRSITVTCSSPKCKVLEMQGEEFVQLISDSPEWVGRSMKDMARRREFNKALNKQHNGTAPLRDLFNMIDTDNDGRLSISEVKTVIKKFDPSFPDEEAIALVESMDLDGNGYITWKEFKRVVGQGDR
ncbi:hypothetical protein TrST_g9511 [Triparma strigata]|uniref:cGMP-dependent protein kinase n=1 Tax=Triparma strigata TaxID=1606541 RepID=A0A9W7ATF2_9STRA|nr:hypothetical protein TrST_g9511 [Triparma strigata]